MTTTVMEHGSVRPNATLPNIVLTLNCKAAQNYLRQNEVLDALDARIHKIDVEFDFAYLNPDIAFEHADRMLGLLDAHQNYTLPNLRSVLKDKGWRHGRIRDAIVNTVRADLNDNFSHIQWDKWPLSIRAVVLLESMLEYDLDIREMLEWQFPNSRFFTVTHSNTKPVRIWATPRCDNCSKVSMRTDDGFVCQGCFGVVLPRPIDL